MNNRIPAKIEALLSALLLLVPVLDAYALVMADCVGEGGTKLCSAPTPSPWAYRLCDNTGAYISRYRAWCEVSGGTYVFKTGPSCAGRIPDAESNLVQRAEAFSKRMSGKPTCPINDSGWGTTTSSSQCNSGAPVYQNGILTTDRRILAASSCGETVFATKNRKLVCPVGTVRYTIGTEVVCVEDQEFSECPAVGNPILPLTGKKIQRETDFSGTLPLLRIYSSKPWFIPYNVAGNHPAPTGGLGEYWRINFSYRLFHLDGNLSRYAISFPNGAIEYFGADFKPTTQLYTNGVLRNDGNQYTYRYDDLRITFSAEGFIRDYTEAGGQTYSFFYSGADFIDPVPATLPNGMPSESALPAGLLLEIRDSGGQIVYKFSYDAGGRIVFVGRGAEKVIYEYDFNDNLSRVSMPGGLIRQYLYENSSIKHALTGILDESGINFAAWTYDATGRAISSTHNGGAEAISLDFSQAANGTDPKILVTSTLGKQSTYKYTVNQGIRRVKSIEGHASENCAAANRAYDYYPNGTLKSKTDWSGNITSYVRDSFGRETSRTEATGTSQARTIQTEYHPSLNLPVRITEPGKVTIMTYDNDGRLLSQSTQPSP